MRPCDGEATVTAVQPTCEAPSAAGRRQRGGARHQKNVPAYSSVACHVGRHILWHCWTAASKFTPTCRHHFQHLCRTKASSVSGAPPRYAGNLALGHQPECMRCGGALCVTHPTCASDHGRRDDASYSDRLDASSSCMLQSHSPSATLGLELSLTYLISRRQSASASQQCPPVVFLASLLA
jgi:hypothetical protein